MMRWRDITSPAVENAQELAECGNAQTRDLPRAHYRIGFDKQSSWA